MSGSGIDEYIGGAVGGAAGLIVGHPFDTTKVQLQTRQASVPYSGTWHALKSINHAGWVRGFFRGLGFPLVSYGVVNSVYFGVYGNALRLLSTDGSPTPTQVAMAGSIGGFAQLFVACPVDVVKVVLQSQIPQHGATQIVKNSKPAAPYFKGPRDCLQALYRTGGMRHCYKGFCVQMLRDVPSSGLYFLVYETLFSYLNKLSWIDSRGVMSSLLAGGAAGVISWYSILPLDVIKSLVQADMTGRKYRGMADCARVTYRKLGLRAFFAGAVAMSVRAFIVNAVIFSVHNQTMQLLKIIRTKKHGCVTD